MMPQLLNVTNIFAYIHRSYTPISLKLYPVHVVGKVKLTTKGYFWLSQVI